MKLVWLVEPDTKSVTVYRHDRTFAVAGPTEELTGENTLPDLRCSVADFFGLPE